MPAVTVKKSYNYYYKKEGHEDPLKAQFNWDTLQYKGGVSEYTFINEILVVYKKNHVIQFLPDNFPFKI